MIRTALRAWGFSLVVLLAACAGLSAVSASSATTSLVRLGVAAGVLSVFAAVIALLLTAQEERTRLRCLLWGATVPLAVGVATAVLAGSAGGIEAALLALLPWLAGPLTAVLLGPYLPALQLSALRRRSRMGHFPI